jgi:hypothetical protein
MSIEFGPHVILAGIGPEIASIFPTISETFGKFGLVAVVTSVTDRSHSRKSLHYSGDAVDILWLPDYVKKVSHERLLRELYTKINGFPPGTNIPPEFDVLFEGNHFHVEHQPKVSPSTYTRMVADWINRRGDVE